MLTGVRKYESSKRAEYDFDMEKAFDKMKNKEYNMPRNWKRISPICYFTNTDIWLFILLHKIDINIMYRYGFDRVGCLICPYASAYTNLLIKHYYDKQWERWRKVLENNYRKNM